MITHQRRLEIDARPEAVWAILSRFMHIDEIAPQVTYVDALTRGANGVGSKRRCYFQNGSSLIEEVTNWEPYRGYSVRLSDMSALPLTEAHAAIEIEPLAGHRAQVIWSMDYTVKYGVLGWIMGQTLMKIMMTRILDSNLKTLSDKVCADQIPDCLPAYY